MEEEYKKEICSNCSNTNCNHKIREYIEDNMFRTVCHEYVNKNPKKRNASMMYIKRRGVE